MSSDSFYDMINDIEAKVESDGGGIRRTNHPDLQIPVGMSYDSAIKVLSAAQDQEGTEFVRKFNYRPLDGAYAAQEVMKRDFGSKGFGTATITMFGKIPPKRISIPTGPGQHASVPWGPVTFPALQAKLTFGATDDAERGPVFELIAEAPASEEQAIEKFFDSIEKYLGEHSLYQGKAIDGASMPDFLDLSGVDEDKIIYSYDTMAKLRANLWGPLEQADTLRQLGLSTKRAVLLEGDYGTGKTLAAFVTARKAMENGWTFIYCRPQDDLSQVMATARLYTPAVVFYEDIDRLADNTDREASQELLDVFDGLKAKPADIMVVATTNHRDRIHKGMLRPGRLDAVVNVGACDAESAERLMKAVIPGKLLTKVDLTAVAEKFAGVTPSFVREAAERSVRYAVAREGTPELTTEDMIHAQDELNAHRRLMNEANEDARPDTLNTVLASLISEQVTEALHGSKLMDRGYHTWTLNTENRDPNSAKERE